MDRIESRILAFMALMAAGAGSAAAQGVQAPIRNQTPDQPLPYPTAEVVVEAGAELSCTISLPKGVGDGAAPGAVLLTVAGANDRDQLRIIGLFAAVMGGLILLLMLVPGQTLAGGLSILFVGGTVGGVGGRLYWAGRSGAKAPHRPSESPRGET